MPTVLRFGGLRVVIYPKDHRREHVHVIGHGCEAIFELNCPHGPVTLREDNGFSRRDVARIQGGFFRTWPRFAAHGRTFMESHDNFELANRAARKLQASLPRAVSAHYDRRIGRVVIRLNSKLDVTFSPHDAEGLENAAPAQLEPIEISPSGFGIHFPKLDADIYLPALLEGFLGSRKWMASRLGASGGKSRSKAKVSAARKNGRLGGRPKKKARAGGWS